MKKMLIVSSLFALLAGLTIKVSAAIIAVNEAEGFMGATKTDITTAHNGSTLLSYDATGVDKLVVAFGFESGFNQNSATVTGVQYNLTPLTQAVQENFMQDTAGDGGKGDYDGGTMSIWYLDSPAPGAGSFTVSYTTSGGGPNGGHASVIGLEGTVDGVGNTGATWNTQTSAGHVATSITTSSDGSWVIAAVENSGANSGAGTPTAVSPLTLSNNGFWGAQWGSAASGYQDVPSGGTTLTPTFLSNAGGNIHVVAAEFEASVPEPSTIILAGLGLMGVSCRRRRQ